MRSLSNEALQGIGIAIGIGAIVAAFVLLGIHANSKPAAKPAPASDVCSRNSMPCIRITEANGSTYGLNDFRFMPGHCIDFIELPDGANMHYCGTYKLDWIGPGA